MINKGKEESVYEKKKTSNKYSHKVNSMDTRTAL